eukprot:CAMPEP_0206201668 /NCGR_PEP_ID=MMETSP0166-20121206/11695_1 /ASSEMBLY_ACC=CAM_ASM_000260 /TAXON_ID=95228 /ORGANISM="Vannella robusta, Strain DIVA3 518/3/11/1/6" /LENGTH=400 /DNA_ID=CAMNT_0053620407 /DNA_START=174 /DNA_END=1376 /DNA_ORIENTATION=+
MYYVSGFSRLLVRHFLWSQLSEVMIRIGFVGVSPKPSTVQNVLSDQLRLLQIRYEIENIIAEREKVLKLFANLGDNETEEDDLEASPEEIQVLLDKLGSDLCKLNEEKAFIKERIRKKRQTSKKAEEKTKNPEHSEDHSPVVSDNIAEWGLGIISTLLTETILYPMFMTETWMLVQQRDCSWWSAASGLLESIRYQNKHLYDGFFVHCIQSVAHMSLMYPFMRSFRRFFSIPEEEELQKSMRTLLSLVSNEDPFEQGEDEEFEWSAAARKREIVTSFRTVMRNTVAYTLSNWLCHCLLYPLSTCRTIMAMQGSSYLAPSRFTSVFSVMKYLNRTSGISGYYRGFSLQLLTIVPELLLLLSIYTGVSIWIEYSLSEEDFDDEEENEEEIGEEIGDDEFIST